MRILITAGGTREPLDDVRFLGNRSSGRTGAWIAEEAVRRFHTVYLLSGEGSVGPARWAVESGLLVHRTFGPAAELLKLSEELAGRGVDAIVAAAAVADYAPVSQAGKISSSLPELTITLRPTPKIIDRLRQAAPGAFLLGFKLEAGLDSEGLAARALATMARSGADAMVANDAGGMGSSGHSAVIIRKDGRKTMIEDRRRLAEAVVDLLEEEVVR